MQQKIEILAIARTLRKLAQSGVLKSDVSSACRQGAVLVLRLRQTVLKRNATPEEIVKKLRDVLVKQGEG
jgi:hypothetical protein